MGFISLSSARKLKDEISKRTLRQNASYILSLNGDSHWLALSFAVGIVLGTSPFYGSHTVGALVLVSVFRFNLVTTMIGAWLTVPPSLPFIYYFGYRLGRILLQDEICIPREKLFTTIEKIMQFNVAGIGLESRDVIMIAEQLLLGCTVLGVTGGIIGYFFLRYAIDRHRAKVLHRKSAT